MSYKVNDFVVFTIDCDMHVGQITHILNYVPDPQIRIWYRDKHQKVDVFWEYDLTAIEPANENEIALFLAMENILG